MDKLENLTGIVAPLDRANVDTDAIIPKQFLKSIKRTGFGPFLFDELRYLDHGEPDMDCSGRPLNTEFVLNQARYAGASILLARAVPPVETSSMPSSARPVAKGMRSRLSETLTSARRTVNITILYVFASRTAVATGRRPFTEAVRSS